MRISDWSSDVCSSDLDPPREERRTATYRDQKIGRERRNLYFCLIRLARRTCLHPRVWIFSNAASRYAIRIPPRVGGSACISLNEKHYEYDCTTKCTIHDCDTEHGDTRFLTEKKMQRQTILCGTHVEDKAGLY